MTRLTPTDAELARLPPETEIEFRQTFIEDAQSGRTRFTSKGFAAPVRVSRPSAGTSAKSASTSGRSRRRNSLKPHPMRAMLIG